jgi:hypothetical protein
MLKTVILIAMLTTLVGCAGMFDAIQRDPVRVEKIKARDGDKIATVSLSAEKRNVLVLLDGVRSGVYCAEPPPEIVKAFNIERESSLKAEGTLTPEKKAEIEAKNEEKTKEAITVLSQRTVLLDVYRTGTYSLCQFYANGAISSEELAKQFESLT